MREKSQPNTRLSGRISRRRMLQIAAGTGAGAVAFTLGSCTAASKHAQRAVTKGRINQSIAYWCFEKYWDVEQTCRIASQLGCKSVELVEPKYWAMLKEYGLVCAIHGSHWFDKGMNNPEYHETYLRKIRDSIDACSESMAFPTSSPSPASARTF